MTAVGSVMNLRFHLDDRALGDDARMLRRRLCTVVSPDTSVALGVPEDRLSQAVERARDVDWDGYGAAAVSPRTVSYAHALLGALSLLARDADIQVDPEGEILFEWAAEPRWILTLAINERGRLAYSALFGSGRVRGVEQFDGSLPATLSHALSRVRDRKAHAEAGRWQA